MAWGNQRMMFRSCLVVLLGLLVGTSAWSQDNSNEHERYLGISDFRYVKRLVAGTDPSEPRCGPAAWEDGNFFNVEQESADRLFAANADTLSIRLKAASFPYFPEKKRFRGDSNVGQIGIFVDVNVAAGGATTPGISQVPGRLIYFDNDYRKGQARITATNSHVFGPVLYPGGGLSLAITLLEFDRDRDDVFGNQVLEGLTKLGTEASRGVPGYLVGPLAALSDAIRNAAKSQDDIFGKGYIGFNGKQAAGNARTLSLLSGDIVFVRKANRETPFDWANMCYSDATGAVTESDGKRKDIRSKFFGYVTLSFLKNADNEATTVKDALTYEAFVKELEKRPASLSASAGAEAALGSLRTSLIDNTLRRNLNDVVAPGIAAEERLRAAYVIAHAVHASLATPSAEALKDPKCAYLQHEARSGAERAILLRRLNDANTHWSRDTLSGKIQAMGSCAQALAEVDALADVLAAGPRASQLGAPKGETEKGAPVTPVAQQPGKPESSAASSAPAAEKVATPKQ